MNPKQFLSSVFFAGIDFSVSRVPVLGPMLAVPLRVVFPTMGYEQVTPQMLRPRLLFGIYALGVFVCFVLQGYLAFEAGHLGTFDSQFGTSGPGSAGARRVMFLDDAHNLFNYLLIVPLYLVAGTGYIISVFSLRTRLAPLAAELDTGIKLESKPYLSGVLAVAVFLGIWLFTQGSYAMDLHEKSAYLFWFHSDSIGSALNFNGHVYLLINAMLGGFVLLIALLHLELFRWSSLLARAIREDTQKGGETESIFLINGNKVREYLAPFTETAIWSKAFAMLLAMNIFTWLASGVSGGIEPAVATVLDTEAAAAADAKAASPYFKLITILYYLIAIWIVSLPRYRVQFEIFKARDRAGEHDYLDIRMPWTIGWSVFIDILLIAFFTTALFGPTNFVDFLSSLFQE